MTDANKTARTTYNILRGGAGATAAATTGSTAPAVEVPVVSGNQGNYTVQAGDYLGKIALNLYGDASKWSNIYEANRSILKNPNDLQPGQVLVIPAA